MQMHTVTDMTGRRVTLPLMPQRIVSLVPSQTELLYALGLHERIAGQTVFCIHPQEVFKTAVKVGGTKKVKYEVIDSLHPDLIICNKEENTLEIVEKLAMKYPVWVSDITTIEDNYSMISFIGALTGTVAKANEIISGIKSEFSVLKAVVQRSALYLIWKNPYIAVASETFINNMLPFAGYSNVLGHLNRYPEITEEDIIKLKPEVVLLSSEPFPFAEKHITELKQLLPDAEIKLVDGEMFSWYGSRMQRAPAYFNQLKEGSTMP